MEEPYRRNELWYLAEGLQQYGDGRILSSAYLSWNQGYHADLYWATLQSKTTPMTVYSETDGIFFRVFTPEEQRDRESRGISVKEYPAGDLSFLFESRLSTLRGQEERLLILKLIKGMMALE